MKKLKRLRIAIPVLFIMLTLCACRMGEERYEVTNYMGKSISAFERKTNTELEKQSNGIYVMEDVMQVIAPEKKVTSVTLLKNAGEYKVFGITIGMKKSEADTLLADTFGKEISKTINSTNNSVTYSYLKNGKELYIAYDVDMETVVELSYYIVEVSKDAAITTTPVNSGELIALIGSTHVYYNEALIYLKSAQEKYEAKYGSNIWEVDILGDGQTFGEMMKEEVMNQITELKIISAKAAEQGITLSEEELAEANAYAKEHYESLIQEDIDQYLVTEELLRQVYADNLLAEKMFETLTLNVDNKVDDLDANQITVQDILIYSVDFDDNGKKVDLTAQEKEERYEKVKTLLSQAKTTEDFSAFATENTQADTVEYTFGRGGAPAEYSAAFEQAAFTLKTGQVSGIITTDYGWHILYCVSDFNEDATTQVKEAIIEDRRTEMFSKLYTEWTKDYDIVINTEAWDAIPYEE
ncbi:MAG: peptidylprolyl isomerase [Mobilitalea sp.]